MKTEIHLIDNNIEFTAKKAASLFNENKIFIIPTDTIYGFSGNPFSKEVRIKINEIKGREGGKKFILLTKDLNQLIQYSDSLDNKSLNFLNEIWPAPVSVILKIKKEFWEVFESETVAFRISANKFNEALMNKIDFPLISTSANRSGQNPLVIYSDINNEFNGEVSAIFYSNENIKPVASTIIDLTENYPNLIREGVVKFSDIISKF